MSSYLAYAVCKTQKVLRYEGKNPSDLLPIYYAFLI